MKKLFLVLFFYLIVTNCNANEQIYETLQKSTVFFSVLSKNAIGSCTGVLIKETENYSYILTARHCVDGFVFGEVEDHLILDVIIDTDFDLGILRVDDNFEAKDAVIFGEKNSTYKDIIYHLGKPHNIDLFVAGKFLASFEAFHVTSISPVLGCSGGGIFDVEGRLIGIMISYIEIFPKKYGNFVNYDQMIGFLRKNNIFFQ